MKPDEAEEPKPSHTGNSELELKCHYVIKSKRDRQTEIEREKERMYVCVASIKTFADENSGLSFRDVLMHENPRRASRHRVSIFHVRQEKGRKRERE